jgi:hypothetical protein
LHKTPFSRFFPSLNLRLDLIISLATTFQQKTFGTMSLHSSFFIIIVRISV